MLLFGSTLVFDFHAAGSVRVAECYRFSSLLVANSNEINAGCFSANHRTTDDPSTAALCNMCPAHRRPWAQRVEELRKSFQVEA